jgi:hypothetical protein
MNWERGRNGLREARPLIEETLRDYEQSIFAQWAAGETDDASRGRLNGAREIAQLILNLAAETESGRAGDDGGKGRSGGRASWPQE